MLRAIHCCLRQVLHYSVVLANDGKRLDEDVGDNDLIDDDDLGLIDDAQDIEPKKVDNLE